jgi:drug/metabolite transporter (DMT)-like permease
MSGVTWALVAGVGFGLFQAVNRRAVVGMSVLVATFLQLLVSAIVLGAISVATEDLAQLWNAPIAAPIYFALAGFFHFFCGWSFLNASQKRIGAARTGALIATVPLFAVVLAAVLLQEIPTVVAMAGILLMIGGVYVIHYSHETAAVTTGVVAPAVPVRTRWGSMLYGLAAAFCMSLSPIFIRQGLEGLSSPILGVTVGVTASALGYGLLLLVRRFYTSLGTVSWDSLGFKLVAGVLVGLATWGRWVALDLAPVAIVLSLMLVSVPVTNLIAPLLVERHLERITLQVWIGSLLIAGGALILAIT